MASSCAHTVYPSFFPDPAWQRFASHPEIENEAPSDGHAHVGPWTCGRVGGLRPPQLLSFARVFAVFRRPWPLAASSACNTAPQARIQPQGGQFYRCYPGRGEVPGLRVEGCLIALRSFEPKCVSLAPAFRCNHSNNNNTICIFSLRLPEPSTICRRLPIFKCLQPFGRFATA